MTSRDGAENCDQAPDKQDAMHPFDQNKGSFRIGLSPLMNQR
jgi:hypothetical protein